MDEPTDPPTANPCSTQKQQQSTEHRPSVKTHQSQHAASGTESGNIIEISLSDGLNWPHLDDSRPVPSALRSSKPISLIYLRCKTIKRAVEEHQQKSTWLLWLWWLLVLGSWLRLVVGGCAWWAHSTSCVCPHQRRINWHTLKATASTGTQ